MSSEYDEEDIEENANLYEARTGLATSAVTTIQQRLTVTRSDHSKSKWDRLTNKYNDLYLELFNEAWTLGIPDEHLETSQIGAVTWTGEEKSKLFAVLDRKGRHDLPALADAVETKSIAEIRDYLLRVEEARNDRQRFSRNTKGVTRADMEAAIEIDADLENRLEENADALAAFQDIYNYSEARSRGLGMWLIDAELAESLSQSQDSSQDFEDSEPDSDTFLLNFFKFDVMLELSRSSFMNVANDSDHDHWYEYAEPNEEPAITLEAARDLYGIIKSLTARILQSALFLAESRLRATTTADYTPARVLKDSDVDAAVDVLNMPTDSFDYWVKFVERSRLKIVAGAHRKGQANAPVTLEQAKILLAAKCGREKHVSLTEVLDSSPSRSSSQSEDSNSAELPGDTETSNVAEADDKNDVADPEPDTEAEAAEAHPANSTGYTAWRKRRAMVEAAEDEYMENLDHHASTLECQSLRTRLGIISDESETKREEHRRPKKLRKLHEDLEDWTDGIYLSPWEKETINADEELHKDEDPL